MKHTLRIIIRSSEEIEVRESNIRLDDKGDTRVPADNGQLFLVGNHVGSQSKF